MDEKVYGWWLPPDVSTHGAKIDQLIATVHWFMLLLFVGWGIFFIYTLIKYRARPGHTAIYAPIAASATKYIEGAVVVVEVFLLFGLSTPVWLAYKNTPPDDAAALHIKIVAEQFAWNFQYPGKDKKFGRTDIALISGDNPLGVDPEDKDGKDDIITVNQLHIPVHTPVVVEVSSKDVIHSFNIPVLRMKQDTIPGQRIPLWFEATQTGHFELACAQLCGLGHYRMRADVLIDSPEDFAKWESENLPPAAEAPAAAAPTETPPAGNTPGPDTRPQDHGPQQPESPALKNEKKK
jgi:cytochrome c oxidase subunit 2